MNRTAEIPQRLLNLVSLINVGIEDPTERKEIERQLGMPKCSVEQAIELLKTKYGIPVVALKKDGMHGYFLPRNEEERQMGLVAYKQQIKTSQQIVEAVEAIDLKEFHIWLARVDEEQIESMEG